MSQDKDPKLDSKVSVYPYGSVLYPAAQLLSLTIAIEVVFPLVAGIKWQGSLLDLWFFGIVYFLAFGICSVAFVAIAGYFGIMMEVAKNLKSYKAEDINDKDVAKSIAVRVLLSNQPRWLISLTPPTAPAMAFAITASILSEPLGTDDGKRLALLVALQALTSFVICLPFILKSQKLFNNRLEEVSKLDDV